MLKEKLQDDLKIGMKSGDADRVGLLRLLLAQIHVYEIEKRGKGDAGAITDEEVILVLQKEAKKRRESIELFRKGDREDLVVKEEKELQGVLGYLPIPPSTKEIEEIIAALYEGGTTDFNSLMKEAMKQLKGKVDGGSVAAIIKKKTG